MALHAQEMRDPFHPMLQDGKTWVAEYSVSTPSSTENHREVNIIQGDTVIHDKTWKKVYSNRYDYPEAQRTDTTYFAAIRQEGNKIYTIYRGRERERLLYDFDAQVGDSFYTGDEPQESGIIDYISDEMGYDIGYGYHNLHLTHIDSIEVSGHILRRFIFYCDWTLRAPSRVTNPVQWEYPTIVWVEGVGAQGGLFHSYRDIAHHYNGSVMCSLDGNVVFSDEDFRVDAVDAITNPGGNEAPFLHMLQDGKTWTTELLRNDRANDIQTDRIEGDTVINGVTWKKLYSNVILDQDDVGVNMNYLAALREDGQKVYIIWRDTDEPQLLYDFDIHPGDHISFVDKWNGIGHLAGATGGGYSIPQLWLSGIDTIEVAGQQLRRFSFFSNCQLLSPPRLSNKSRMKYPNYVWVEGFGAEGGILRPWGKMMSDRVECSINGSVVFTNEDFHPERYTAIYAPKAEDNEATDRQSPNHSLFDLSGRRLSAPPVRGAYIENGKVRMK